MDPQIRIIVKAVADAAERELKKLKGTVEQTGKAGKKASGGLAGFNDKLEVMKKSMGAVIGAAVTFKKAFDFSKEGAYILDTQDRLDRLAVSVGTTSDAILTRLHDAMGGLVTDAEMASGAVDIISLGLADNEDSVVRLATVVGKLGWDMQQVILTFANDSKMRLDALGLSVTDVEARMKALEAQGYSTTEAFDLAVIEAGEAKLQLLGDAADTNVAAWSRLETAIGNTIDKVKVWLAEGLMPWLDILEGGKLNINDALIDHEQHMRDVAGSYDEYINEMIRAYAAAGKHIGITEEGIKYMVMTETSTEAVGEALDILTQNQWESIEAMERNAELTDSWQRHLYGAAATIRGQVNPSITAFEMALAMKTDAIIADRRATEALNEAHDRMALGLEKVAERQKRLAGHFVEADDDIVKLIKGHGELVTVLSSSAEQYDNARLAMLEAEDAAVKLAEAEQKLAENSDPDAQRELEIAVLRARDAYRRAAGEAEGLNKHLTDGYAYTADLRDEIQKAFTPALYDMLTAAGLSAEELGNAGVAMGIYSEETAEAMLKVALITDYIDIMKKAVKDGTPWEIAIANAKAYIDMLMGIPTNFTTNIELHYIETGAVGSGHAIIHGGGGIMEGMQAGGQVRAGQRYVVGEAGPEVFVPGVGGQIIPNHEITNNNYNLTIHSNARAESAVSDFHVMKALAGA